VPLARRLSVLTDQSLTARRADSLHVRFGPGLIDARNDASRHGAQTDDYGGPAAGRRAGGTGRRCRDRLVVGAHRCGL